MNKVLSYADDFKEYLTRIAAGERVRINDAMYAYWLGVLPPVMGRYAAHFPDGTQATADFGFAEGAEPITFFGHDTDGLWAQRSNIVNIF